MVQGKARGRMTVAEFLEWDDGTDTRYQLLDGVPVGMATPAPSHGRLAIRIGSILDRQLSSPCAAFADAGIVVPGREDTYYQADVAVSCTEQGPGEQMLREPKMIAEVLSPTTYEVDAMRKAPDYAKLESVDAILLISSVSMSVEVRRREGARWTVETHRTQEDPVELSDLGVSFSVGDLYEGVPLESDGE